MHLEPKERDRLNNAYYDAFPDIFDVIPFEDVLLDLFLKYVPNQSDIVEIGSGAGALALWLKDQGHKVICVEPAEIPAEKARKKNLTVVQTRIQDFHTDQKFNSVVAISSLIHVPLSEMPMVIKKISDLLTPSGIAIFSFIEGEGEQVEDPTEHGKDRFFAKLSESDLQELINPYFMFREMKKIEVPVMKQFFFLMVLQKL